MIRANHIKSADIIAQSSPTCAGLIAGVAVAVLIASHNSITCYMDDGTWDFSFSRMTGVER